MLAFLKRVVFVPLLLLAGSRLSLGTDLHVFAAASLRESFQEISRDFEAKNPGVHVVLTFAGSQQLASQISEGAPCDVFASADERSLDKSPVAVETRKVFAKNVLSIVTSPNIPRLLRMTDFSLVDKIVLADPAVPAGAYSQAVLDAVTKNLGVAWLTQLQSHVVSKENDVRAVLTKVELGEANGGMVYHSDAVAAKGKVREFAIPRVYQPKIEYPVALTQSATKDPGVARLGAEFVRLLISPTGKAVLKAHGFVTP